PASWTPARRCRLRGPRTTHTKFTNHDYRPARPHRAPSIRGRPRRALLRPGLRLRHHPTLAPAHRAPLLVGRCPDYRGVRRGVVGLELHRLGDELAGSEPHPSAAALRGAHARRTGHVDRYTQRLRRRSLALRRVLPVHGPPPSYVHDDHLPRPPARSQLPHAAAVDPAGRHVLGPRCGTAPRVAAGSLVDRGAHRLRGPRSPTTGSPVSAQPPCTSGTPTPSTWPSATVSSSSSPWASPSCSWAAASSPTGSSPPASL